MAEAKLDVTLFRGFGGVRAVCVAGRVHFESQLVPEWRTGGSRRRLKDAWRLLISRRVPSADIELTCCDMTWHAKTDRHGYFFSCHAVDGSVYRDELWINYSCKATHATCARPIEAAGEILTTPRSAERLVISDIDDTIVHTGVANKLKMLWHLYFTDSNERGPFPDMDAFLRRLHQGAGGQCRNPMLYVSRSPWSIYPMLEAFFKQHSIPVGPVLLLRDWGISWRHPLPRRAEDHKARMIDSALQAFPDLPVVLIGDSGQRDPEVYTDVANRYPARISAIYIRDLALSAQRTQELRNMKRLLAALGIDFVVSNDTEGFVSHAQDRGWLTPAKKAEPAEAQATGP